MRVSQLVEASRAWLGRASLSYSLIRKSPHVLVVPVALFCLMTALGIWGVKTAVRNTEEAERSKAALDADSASQALQLAIQRATLPLTQLSEIIKIMPQWSQIEKQWAISAPAVWLGATKGSLLLTADPFGVNRLAYPTNLTEPFSNSFLYGLNALLPPLRDLALPSLEARTTTIQGPVVANNKYLLCDISHPIYFPNMSADFTWDYRFNEALCPPDLCYNTTTRTRWWGGVSLILDAAFLFGPEGALSSLLRKGYQYQLWQPPVAPYFASSIESIATIGGKKSKDSLRIPPKEPVRGLVPIADLQSNKTEPLDAVAVTLPVVNQMWELHVWKDSWAPSWMMPLIAVVVLGAFLVSVLVFTTLYSWAENRALLHSLLPKETIKRMRDEGKWATGQDDEAMKIVELDTPAELMLRIIEDCIAGRNPALPLLLSVRDALHRSADVYRPSEQQIRNRMNELANLDDEVRNALTAQLMGTFHSAFRAQAGLGIDLDDGSSRTSPTLLNFMPPLALVPEDKAFGGMGLQPPAYDYSAQIKSVHAAEEQVKAAVPPAQLSALERSRAGVSITGQALSRNISQQLSLVTHTSTVCSGVQRWCENEAQAILASWLLQTPAVLSLVEEAGSKPAPAQAKARLVGPDGSAGDNAEDPVEPMTVVMKPILTQLEKVLHTADDWAFDAFALEEASHGRPLSCLGYWLLHKTGLKSWAHIKTNRLISFLERIEAGYADNPYHNKRHAADVLQSTHVIMHRSGLMPGFADQLTLLGCYLSAMVHDFEHVGRNNDFLINSSDELAVRYNDRSPMENHHLAAAWSILKTKECNILSGLPASDVGKLRKLVIDLVLGTDMKQHFAIQGQFETMVRQANEQPSSERNSSRRTSNNHRSLEDRCKLETKPVNEQDQLLTLQMMLKCADIGSLTAPLQVYLKWVSALEAEMFQQGDDEKALGIGISPLCDRTKEGVTKAQTGFFDFVGVPLFKAFCNRFTGALPLLTGVLSNQSYWKSVASGQATQ